MVDSVGDDVFTDVAGASVTFVEETNALEILDPVERHRVRLETPTDVHATDIPTDEFPIPLDTAVSFRTDTITFPVVAVHVRTPDGDLVTQTEHFAYEELPAGEYLLDLATPIKVYMRVDGPLTIRSDVDQTHLEFDEETTVDIGARSFHDSPAGTITTTDDPRDVMAALSAFGKALKTTRPDRSYPTLRGHPPRLKRGDSLSIPPHIRAESTPITVELPPSFEYVYPAASLAYYLGATLEPGPHPRIVTDDGFEYALDGPNGFEATVARVLKHVFVLDCVTRTEGYYDVPLGERDELEHVLDVSVSELYDASDTERLRAYLSVPFDDVESVCPTWKLTADVAPTAANVELLPYLVDELAVVRTPTEGKAVDTTPQITAVNEFLRNTATADLRGEGATRTPEQGFVRPAAADSVEQTWAGEGVPVGASKAMVSAFENRLDRTLAADDITITVVCNDAKMVEERNVVDEVYGSRDELPFDIRVHERLTRADLREVLAADTDFLHYIGHIDDEGIECTDGKLDVGTVSSVGVDAFLLNACSSYRVGMDLVNAGAIGGIVTLSDVLNNAAVTMGKTLARLLNVGYPLGVALNVARDESYAGGQYVTVGDGGIAIAQPESNLPDLVAITDVTGDRVGVTYRTYLTTGFGMGTLMLPTIRDESQYYLAPVDGGVEYEMSISELQEFLETKTPIRYDGELHWADTFDFDLLD